MAAARKSGRTNAHGFCDLDYESHIEEALKVVINGKYKSLNQATEEMQVSKNIIA